MAIKRYFRDLQEAYVINKDNGKIIGNLEALRNDKSLLNDVNFICDYQGSYSVDLDFWDIDEATTPLETTQRLNNLFIWAAKCNGLTDIIFPKDIVLTLDVEQDTVISRNSNTFYSFLEYPQYFAVVIQDLNNVDINWNGCTLDLIGNPYTRYQNIYIKDCRDMVMSNGIILGERLEHDYLTNPLANATHEHGHGILGEGLNENITLKNMYIKRVMGYGVAFYITEPYINSLFQTAVDLNNIEAGSIDTFGNDIVDVNYTRSEMKDLPVGYYPLQYLTLTGLGFFSADGIIDNCVITVHWYDENDNHIYSETGDEGSKVIKPLAARKYRLAFKQPLLVTKWFEGAIDDTTGNDMLIPSELLGEPVGTVLTPQQISDRNDSAGRFYGRTELTPFTEKENTYNVDSLGNRYFTPQRLFEITMFNYGKFTGITVYFYDVNGNFISSSPYSTNAIAIPATATQWRMFGRSTPYNTRASRFKIFFSPINNCKNIVIDSCTFMENRSMGGAGIYNGLTVKNSTFIRNGVTIEGNGKGIALGYGWDLEEGHKINKNVIFENNRFTENFEGSLLFFPLDDLTVINNYFDDRKVVIYNKINRAVIRNNTYINCDKGDIRGDFDNVNATLINCRIDSQWGNLKNSTLIDCFIEGGTAVSDFDAESTEDIIINNCKVNFTNDYDRLNFITTYAKTRVVLNNCELINDSEVRIGLINSTESGSVFRVNTAIGLELNDCKLKGLGIRPDSRISKIINCRGEVPLIFNASLQDSELDVYKGIQLKSNDLKFFANIGGSCRLNFDLKANMHNNILEMSNVQQTGSFMFDFTQGLETRKDTFLLTSNSATDVFRTVGDVKVIDTEVRANNNLANIIIGGTIEEHQPLYVPAKQ